MARTIEHPHVCRVMSFGQVDGYCFLTMELATGGSLARELRAQAAPKTLAGPRRRRQRHRSGAGRRARRRYRPPRPHPAEHPAFLRRPAGDCPLRAGGRSALEGRRWPPGRPTTSRRRSRQGRQGELQLGHLAARRHHARGVVRPPSGPGRRFRSDRPRAAGAPTPCAPPASATIPPRAQSTPAWWRTCSPSIEGLARE